MSDTAGPTHVLVADADWPYREALARLIDRHANYEMVASVRTAAEAVEAAARFLIDVAIVAPALPDMSVCDLVPLLREAQQNIGVIVFTAIVRADELRRALAAGARGYVVKSDAQEPETMFDAIAAVHSGRLYVSEQASALAQSLAASARDEPAPHGLTPREIEVLTLLARGLSNKLIARELSLTEQAVKNHVGRILRKLEVPNRTQAAMVAHSLGLVL
jgi:DNA-binding NarL/FixJ family response regulator